MEKAQFIDVLGIIKTMPPKFLSRLSQAIQKNRADTAGSSGSATSASRTTFGIGALINERYRLDAEIGRGGMGIVYRAHDIPKGRDVALKIINLYKANALSLQQFSREAEIMSQLQHPHIAAVYETGNVDTGGSEPSPFIVMELVQGRGLDELRGFTYAKIVDIGRQICDALAYAHEQGFVHRDLKPANVLIEKRGFHYFAKLMDFGLARPRDAENLPAESNMAGTIYYLAPEVIAGQPADVCSDLYALGAMLYEMITGRVPFSDFIDDQAILTQHLQEAVAPPSHSRDDVPHELEAIVLRLLEKDPKDRFISAREVHQELERVRVKLEADATCGNLPPVPTNFSRCENDIAQVKQLLESSHLVTILGDDGILALATGAQMSEPFPDGVWLVDMERVDEPGLVLPTAAAALGVSHDLNRALSVLLIEFLREKHLLLIIDHCDHLTVACAQLAETILRSCPEVRLLVTSQQALNIPGEACYP